MILLQAIQLFLHSGYIGFIGEVSAQYGGTLGKIISVVLGVSSGIITGAFDHKLNPNKEMDNITGAVVAGIGAGWIGGKAGFFWMDQQERQLELLQALLQALYVVMIYTILLTKNLILLNLIVLLRLNAKAQQI